MTGTDSLAAWLGGRTDAQLVTLLERRPDLAVPLPSSMAVLAARARPAPTRRNRVTSVWALLVVVAPELGEWADYFAAGASKRAAAEAGIPRVVSAQEADDLLRAAEQFVAVVEEALGVARQPTLDGIAA